MDTYCLEVYEADSDEVLATFEAGHPFLAISVGDIINPHAMMHVSERKTDSMLRVVAIEHMIFGQAPNIKHKICIYTESAPDKRETRHPSVG